MTVQPDPVSPYLAGVRCKCPRCGEGALYQKYLSLAECCDRCGLDYTKADSGDGPAVFVIFIVGFVALLITFLMRFSLGAPIWLAMLTGMAVTAGLSLILLPVLKALLIALQYAHKAEEARPEDSDWS